MLAGDDAANEIRDLTRGKGADVVIDIVGADGTLALAAAVTRPLGHLTIVGIAGGTLPVSFFGIGYEVSVATTYWGTFSELLEVLALAEAGRIRPPRAALHPRQRHRRVQGDARRHAGRSSRHRAELTARAARQTTSAISLVSIQQA